uniref:Ribonuclease toxin, BrnT, of type II toxin-antitoxin system n=1 Tax=Candidatus Kentrum sp. SD TaxID=2126332 RepID=A0A450YAD8_9GAMM|nr:MAG: Ribonuclease toxin, BrnT, of type II toxin-antitoxin system [Candidatus Kentron sp. SD]VFK44822.1 MAG: Ribonuclease toxin, BrnT, of type II toxin-antitoxin system [Candidatus Kentron sp. SD]
MVYDIRQRKSITWNPSKNDLLKRQRGITFEEVMFHMQADDIIETFDHPNQERYPGQRIHAIAIKNYVYLVPFVESENEVFLKTIIPSRKAAKQYKGVRNG